METREVVVKDIKMGFWSMVVFMVKWALAAIPAFFILTVVAALAFQLLMLLVGGDASPGITV